MTDKLKELQYAAQECKDIRGLPPSWYDFDTLAITYGIGHTDAMLISAASPDAILALIAEVERLKARTAELKQANSDLAAAGIVPDGYELAPIASGAAPKGEQE